MDITTKNRDNLRDILEFAQTECENRLSESNGLMIESYYRDMLENIKVLREFV